MSHFNKAILKVAKENPEFRKALVAELRTAGDLWDRPQFKLRYLSYAAAKLKKLQSLSQDWDFPFHLVEGWPDEWAKMKALAEEAKEAIDIGMEGLAAADTILKSRRARGDKRKKYFQAVLDEMVRSAPPGVSGATRLNTKYWNPAFGWKGPGGSNRLNLDFDRSINPFSEAVTERVIDVETNRGKSFIIKNPNNPARAAQAIWTELENRGGL